MRVYTLLRLPGLRLAFVDYGFSGCKGPDGKELHSGTALKAYWGHRLHSYRCWVLS